MKKLFFTMVALIMATLSYAQGSVLATLSHEGEISTFYGAKGLKNAHAAADHGDVITLSSGSFQAVDITKAVTIRGAGMQTDPVAKIYPTIILGAFNINVADSLEQGLTIEGIYCDNNTVTVYNTLSNATFLKTRFYDIKPVGSSSYGWGFMKNVAFIHCKIASAFTNKNGSNSVSFVNSVVMAPSLGSSGSGYSNNSFEFTNCVVRWPSSGQTAATSFYAIYRNCILASQPYSNYNSTSHTLSKTNLIYNCLGIVYGITGMPSIFSNLDTSASEMFYTSEDMSEVFKSWTGTYYDTEDFELTEEAKTKYLGDDGKELGIYGGNLPFTPNPSNPKITKFNVASKSTIDGKLSVDIEVKAAE